MFNLNLPAKRKTGRVFYTKDVDMRLSFDRLAKIADENLGASLDLGDIVVFDNSGGDKRKFLMKTKKGYIQVYGRLDRGHGKFLPLTENDGKVWGGHKKQLFH